MKISEELKSNLLADVENILELDLTEDQKFYLGRCFEQTIFIDRLAINGHSRAVVLTGNEMIIDSIREIPIQDLILIQSPEPISNKSLLNSIKTSDLMVHGNYKSGQQQRRERRKNQREQ